MKYLSFWRCLFSFRRCHVHLQSYLNARWRPDSVKESNSKSLANSRRQILQFPIVAHLSAWLNLSVQFIKTMKKIPDKTHPCRSPTPTWNRSTNSYSKMFMKSLNLLNLTSLIILPKFVRTLAIA